jgi:hypothetical protein
MWPWMLGAAMALVFVARAWPRDGSGRVVEEGRRPGAFDAVSVAGRIRLEITVGAEPSATVRCDDDLARFVRTIVSGTTLEVSTRRRLRPTEPLVVRLATPQLVRVEAAGAAWVAVEGVDTRRFEARGTGTSVVSVRGECDEAALEAVGAAQVRAARLEAQIVEARAVGAGRLECRATDEARAVAIGAAQIRVLGDPPRLLRQALGTSRIEAVRSAETPERTQR